MFWLIAVLGLCFVGLYGCAQYVFAPNRKHTLDPYILPKGEIYQKNPHITRGLIEGALQFPFEAVEIISHDGLRLYGRYYAGDGGPVQIMFHGYQSSAIRDFCGGMQLGLELGCSVLLVDQRAHGNSGGKYLTFGVKERLDCLDWVRYAAARWPQRKIVLTGISMGAATVLMASDLAFPNNVAGIISDCGYTSPRDILRQVIADMHLPVGLTYGMVRLAGKLFCGFDTDAGSAPRSLAKTDLPVLFIHGEADDFVPCAMSRENYAACAGEKTILTVPGAAHGLSYTTDYPAYRKAVAAFLEKYAK